jgi:lipoate-protein ligase A
VTQVHLLDVTFASPAHNLACDEALLDELESGYGAPTLRFWESVTPFVVLGYANKIATEVNRAACERLRIPILRRSSGGGTVVQGFGCLNYTLTLPIEGDTANITETNCFIMRRHRDALSTLLGKEIQIQGHTDLTLGGLKFSGNAQRRKSRALLFHGSILHHFDLALIDEVLLHPSKEPEYRARRSHRDFLINLNIDPNSIKEALSKAWSATERATTPSHIRIEPHVRERFENPEWNEKF